jgi:hypothetical protein
MNYREIKLSNGKVVTVENFKMEFIYDGILVGKPNKEINDRLISNVIKTFNSNKVLVLMDDAYASEDILKPILYSAQFVAEPINDTKKIYDGSSLNIVWFGDDFKSNTIKNLIMNLIEFDWDTEAENYQF